MANPLKLANSNNIQKLPAKTSQGKLKITTFLNNMPLHSQNAFFKACTHPLAINAIKKLVQELESYSSIAFYDPFNNLPAFSSLHNLEKINVSNIYVQQIPDINKVILDCSTKPIDEINSEKAQALVIFAFDAQLQITNIKHLLPENCKIITLDRIKIPGTYLTKPENYLNQLNFATNFGFLRDENGLHTRITLANYWGSYGAKDAQMCFFLFDKNGKQIAKWQESLGAPGQQLTIDSRDIKARFKLEDFTGSLFMHGIKIIGHDIVKYVCDVFDSTGKIHSVTHDSNSWPADFYAGIAAPQEDEKVILWVQNCHPIPIEPGNVGVRLMGREDAVYLDEQIPPFGTYAWDLGAALPAEFPAQYEVIANKYFTRPRFEVVQKNGYRYITHANVERVDLLPDTNLPTASKYLGKGYILPFPIMPTDKFDTIIIPTPMSTTQNTLNLHFYVYDEAGKLVATKTLPPLSRNKSIAINAATLLDGVDFSGGHVELAYDPEHLENADSWLHAMVRYVKKDTGQAAETSFGAHIYNTPVVYKNEPQAYKGNPPGLRTTLVLRTYGGADTFCNLIYPCSKEWLPESSTDLILHNEKGVETCRKQVKIPLNGSLLWSYKEIFDANERSIAGKKSYIVVKDTTCRLFGFHGQVNDSGVFSLDHMFGF